MEVEMLEICIRMLRRVMPELMILWNLGNSFFEICSITNTLYVEILKNQFHGLDHKGDE